MPGTRTKEFNTLAVLLRQLDQLHATINETARTGKETAMLYDAKNRLLAQIDRERWLIQQNRRAAQNPEVRTWFSPRATTSGGTA